MQSIPPRRAFATASAVNRAASPRSHVTRTSTAWPSLRNALTAVLRRASPAALPCRIMRRLATALGFLAWGPSQAARALVVPSSVLLWMSLSARFYHPNSPHCIPGPADAIRDRVEFESNQRGAAICRRRRPAGNSRAHISAATLRRRVGGYARPASARSKSCNASASGVTVGRARRRLGSRAVFGSILAISMSAKRRILSTRSVPAAGAPSRFRRPAIV
jgi:hypothetical protein